MDFIREGLRQAAQLILHWNPDLTNVVMVTLRVAGWSTLIALAVGLPVALALALGRFPLRTVIVAIFNAGLGLPPVVVGLVLSVLFFRQAPLGFLHLIYTVNGMIVAQTALSFPIIVALSTSALQTVDRDLLLQARALGASRRQIAVLALREARIGILAAVVGALGSALSEVGAIILVGGNVHGSTETLASAVLVRVSSGDYAQGIALGILLLGLIAILSATITIFQQRDAR